MLVNDQRAIIADQVNQYLPDMKDKSEKDLYVMIGKEMALPDVSVTLPESEVEQEGRNWFTKNIQVNSRIRTAICENTADIRDFIDKEVTLRNVTAVVTAIVSILGLPAIAIPAAAVAVGVLVVKIGLNDYCRGYLPKM